MDRMSQKKTRKEHEQEINYRLARYADAIRCEEGAKTARHEAHEALVKAMTAALDDGFEVTP